MPVRIGIVGAGDNTRTRHIPGFRAIDGVEIVGVVNRRAESTARVAESFGIPKTYSDWRALIDDTDIDAVMIGTWPYLHCEITCAALEAGKHVLTEARMARTAAEARQMHDASSRYPNLVTQIVPSPFGLECHDFLVRQIQDGFLGELREVVVIGTHDGFADPSDVVHWRQDQELSGYNTLSIGIMHETVSRWVPATTRVFAQTTNWAAAMGAGQDPLPTVPDSLQIVTQLEGGARGLYHFSGVARFGPGHQIHLYGSQGTIRLEFGEVNRIGMGRAGDDALHEPKIPENERGAWRVEAEFIGAIRGEETIRFTDFPSGVRYMNFTEAIHRSAAQNEPVAIPLVDVGSVNS